jgi:hypothetical protein
MMFVDFNELFKGKQPAFPHKKEIVDYLYNGGVSVAAAPSIPKDILTGETIHLPGISEQIMSDGDYSWNNQLAYYVDKYNTRLPVSFENHILAHQKVFS